MTASGLEHAAATGASDESGDTDGDSGSDDLNEDCQLPEVVTKSVTTMSRWERQAKLAADRFLIDSSLGQFNVRKYVPQPLTVSHTEMGETGQTGGRRRVEKGLVLVPRPDAVSASGGKDETVFEKTRLVRDGVYSDLQDYDEFVNVSEKVALQCRKTQATHWKTDDLSVFGRGYVVNKGSRGQVGWQTYAAILKDLVKGCGASALLVNDFMAGVGEVGVAALHVRCAQEAKDANVRLCYWGYEDKRVFADIARANINTAFGSLYLEGRLVISGLTPVADPGPPPAASGAPNKTAITEMLGGPLKQLTVDDQGRLVVPTLEAWNRDGTAPPVPMTPELADFLKTLHAEFLPPQATPPAVPAPKAAAALLQPTAPSGLVNKFALRCLESDDESTTTMRR